MQASAAYQVRSAHGGRAKATRRTSSKPAARGHAPGALRSDSHQLRSVSSGRNWAAGRRGERSVIRADSGSKERSSPPGASRDRIRSSAGTALLCLSPVLLAVAAAIILTSRRPVLFRQVRAGRHGASFQVLKFRSMVDGAEAQRDDLMHLNESDGLFKIADDPRITAVGRLIRRFHLDELPQLVNVLRGDMSLVGPRPLVLEEDRRIEGWHRRRLDLRPGITGPWQVLGASRIPVSEVVRLDSQDVADGSLWNDIRVLMLTVPVIVRRRGL